MYIEYKPTSGIHMIYSQQRPSWLSCQSVALESLTLELHFSQQVSVGKKCSQNVLIVYLY